MYLNFHLVYWLLKSGFRRQLTCIKDSPGCRDDLTATSMDSIRVQRDVMDVETDTTQVLLTQYTLKQSIVLIVRIDVQLCTVNFTSSQNDYNQV